ncbi:MAG: citrate lyase acyl carrier protein [Oscillibacter sp.]|nr:citrate lyase acyl carrier protein [Oscillibacter sp.]
MEIKKAAVAGTMESSDCMVTIRPGDGTIDIQLDSDVKVMFGDSILATVRDTLAGLGVTSAEVDIRDRGALDCVIRARVECAVCRAAEEAFDWKKEDAYHG